MEPRVEKAAAPDGMAAKPAAEAYAASRGRSRTPAQRRVVEPFGLPSADSGLSATIAGCSAAFIAPL